MADAPATGSNVLSPVTEAEAQEFIDQWFGLLDVHAPAEEVLPLVADEELVMKLPETTARGHGGFIQWYDHAIKTFFDEIHTILASRIAVSRDIAKIELILQWEPSVWSSPDAKSKRLGFYAAQTWELKRSPQTRKLHLITYNVDYFLPMPGSEGL